MKPVIHIIDLAEGCTSPADDVLVMSQKNREVKPNLIKLDDNYTPIDVDTYEHLLNELIKLDNVDAVKFTLRPVNSPSLEITRIFMDGNDQTPLVESSALKAPSGETCIISLFARTDIVEAYPVTKPLRPQWNLPCCADLAGELFTNQNAQWGDVVSATEDGIVLMAMLTNDTKRGIEDFVRDGRNWQMILAVYDSYAFGEMNVTQLRAAELAIMRVMQAMVDVIAKGVFGENFTPENVQTVLDASVFGLDQLCIDTYLNSEGMESEKVFAVHTPTGQNTEKLYLAFGQSDEQEATATFVQEFELEAEDITATTLKSFEFIYNL